MFKSSRNFRTIFAVLLTFVIVLTVTPISGLASSTAVRGTSKVSQTVYLGPSASNYAPAGSIGANELVYILGREKDVAWLHIQYHAGNVQKTGYAPTSTITITVGNPENEEFYGGYCYANTAQTIWSCDVQSIATNIGTIYAGEGATRLYAYNNVMLIEYSTPTGAKRGYVFNPNFSYPYANTCVVRVITSSNLYYSDNAYNSFSGTTFAKSGYVGAGEYVAVLAKYINLLYVEYNSPEGRRRGHLPATCVEMDRYNRPAVFADPHFQGCGTFTINAAAYMNVYSGPSTEYPVIGSLSPGDTVVMSLDQKINGYRFAQYHATGTSSAKAGYVFANLF